MFLKNEIEIKKTTHLLTLMFFDNSEKSIQNIKMYSVTINC